MRVRAGMVAGALLLAACTRQSTLLTDLSTVDAFAIQHALSQAHISATATASKEGRMSIAVPDEQQASARRVLLEQGLPRPEYQSFGDIFGKEGMLTSPFEERARYLYASSQGLENTLRNIDGVVFAKVHIVMPEARSLIRDGVPASASVFLKYRPPSKVLTMGASIQRLVANAIPGLQRERVEVVINAIEDPVAPFAGVPVLPGSAASVQGATEAPSRSGFVSHLLAMLVGAAAALAVWRIASGRWAAKTLTAYPSQLAGRLAEVGKRLGEVGTKQSSRGNRDGTLRDLPGLSSRKDK